MPLFGPPDVAQLKAKRDIQGLIKALGYTADVSVRRAAAAALGELGDARAVAPLSLALRNPDWEHDWHDMAAAADALVRLGEPSVGPLIAALAYHSRVVRVSAAEALGAIGRPAVQPLLVLLGDDDLENRETAGQVLAEIGADAVDQLIEALSDESSGRRLRAAKVLGEIGDPRAVERLSRALKDQIAGVRQMAARSLGKIADARAADSLVAALGDPDPSVGKAAALSLGSMGDPRAVPTLLDELRGAGRQLALDALVKIGVPAAEPMVAMLADSMAREDETWLLDELRSEVAGALARIGYPKKVAAMVADLFAEQPAARGEAATELVRLSQMGGLDDLTKDLVVAIGPMVEQARVDELADDGGHADRGAGDASPG
jgi:HEAT repeat protein